ncbi:type II CAAX prenyl endopeptidase Rce1 family protein [Halosolutus amylolyticus]|uniref:Type II CAAX prenyl endopeptidase Rce1 family protein n=1 Tax=Halosolutus amylolyticus TaxID=2932267 RepID=A0ABD5PJ03_9EURY|nr:CPBP family glutamic-type intramembrane protease [Halosolutus amylolyticus]
MNSGISGAVVHCELPCPTALGAIRPSLVEVTVGLVEIVGTPSIGGYEYTLSDTHVMASVIFGGVIVAPLAEEVLFRGFLIGSCSAGAYQNNLQVSIGISPIADTSLHFYCRHSRYADRVTGGGMASVIQGRDLPVDAGANSVVWINRFDAVLSLVDDPLPLVLVGTALVAAGVVFVAWFRSTGPTDDPTDRTGADSSGNEIQGEPASATFEERIGETTLERLEPIVPDAVEHVRDLRSDRREGHEFDREQIDRAVRELRRGLEDALADGRLKMKPTAPDGEPYEIVNLPSRYRELSIPPSDRTVYLGDAEQAVQDRLENGTLREAAMAAEAVDEHREEITNHVCRNERQIVELRREVTATLTDVRELVERLDGALADRVDDFVLAGRHDEFEGIAEIERDISDATYLLHRCSFNDSQRELRDAAEAADDLLVTVDFLGGLVGTIEHGSGTVELPDAVPKALVSDLTPIIERQYDVDAKVTGTAIAINDRNTPDTEDSHSTSRTGSRRTEEGSAAGDVTAGTTASMGSRSGVATGDVADEILFVLRELDGGTNSEAVQYQTERLPNSVARSDILEELVVFCRRQTDIVAAIDLQEGAPPGFLEIEFTDRTAAQSGLETLRNRFLDRHGG